MEAMELNGGRFYLRPLHDDDRIDDRPALSQLSDTPDALVAAARAGWASESKFTWAVCEQTNVEMLALAVYENCTITVTPVGDTQRILPNDPVLPQKTVEDAVIAGEKTVARWVEGFLNQ
ncbi:MAG: hypothetical protein Q4A92_03955 [Corynebacterium sp.]|nr:hypothetical protein [Corynebacterium sp.]